MDRHIRELEEIVSRRPLEGYLEAIKKRVAEVRIAAESMEDDGWHFRECDDGTITLNHPFRFPRASIDIAVTGHVMCRYGTTHTTELLVEKDPRFVSHSMGVSVLARFMMRDPREEILRAIEATRLMVTALSSIEHAKIRKKSGFVRFLDSSERHDRRMLRSEPIFARISSTKDCQIRDCRASDVDKIIAELRKG